MFYIRDACKAPQRAALRPEGRRLMAGLVEGKVALVTGAASGIGRAAALAFAREGARVLASDVDAAHGEETAARVRAAGAEARFVAADVTDEAAVEALLRAALDAFGRLDCALNNAGITGAKGLLQDIEREGFERTLTVNLTSVFLCMKHELRVMRAQGSGAIVNTSSGAGVVPAPGLSPYCASKHAILGLTRTAAVENARSGVRVNAICPGSVDTPMLRAFMQDPEAERMIRASQPGGRLGTAEEIAEAAVWLCSDRASFVSGASLLVDGAAVAR
jgi:NAD(P)-dependent dehydrogenase (short-subunit alcohol dehydrogenase family)